MVDDARIPLAQAIEDLPSGLLLAVASGKGQALQFRLKPIGAGSNGGGGSGYSRLRDGRFQGREIRV